MLLATSTPPRVRADVGRLATARPRRCRPCVATALAARLSGSAQWRRYVNRPLLPPPEKRGLVLIDPPYEAQLDEFDTALAAIREALARWPQGMVALWYPIKQRRVLQAFYRRAAALEAKSALLLELLVRADDSPLRMNGSGMLLLNPPWQFDAAMRPALEAIRDALGETGAEARVEWLRRPA